MRYTERIAIEINPSSTPANWIRFIRSFRTPTASSTVSSGNRDDRPDQRRFPGLHRREICDSPKTGQHADQHTISRAKPVAVDLAAQKRCRQQRQHTSSEQDLHLCRGRLSRSDFREKPEHTPPEDSKQCVPQPFRHR
jgi:hypothetical protein